MVHILEGEVEVAVDGDAPRKVRLEENQAMRIDAGSIQFSEVSSDSKRFVRSMEPSTRATTFRDDFSTDTSGQYVGSDSYLTGGSFTVNQNGNGRLRITTGHSNTYSAVSKRPCLSVGQRVSVDASGKSGDLSVFLMVSTVAAQPIAGSDGSYGFRLRRDNKGIRVEQYDSSWPSWKVKGLWMADPDERAPLRLIIERLSPTECKFYFDAGAGPVPIGIGLVRNDALGPFAKLHVGVQAYGYEGDTLSFDNLLVEPIEQE